MVRGNYLRTDVMGCLTPSPRIIKSSNPSLVRSLVFMHILFKIIKPSRYRWPITLSISRWLVATPNLVFSIPIVISTNMLEHTHTYICTCFHNMFTKHTNIKSEIPPRPMEVRVGINDTKMIFQRQQPIWLIFIFVPICIFYFVLLDVFFKIALDMYYRHVFKLIYSFPLVFPDMYLSLFYVLGTFYVSRALVYSRSSVYIIYFMNFDIYCVWISRCMDSQLVLCMGSGFLWVYAFLWVHVSLWAYVGCMWAFGSWFYKFLGFTCVSRNLPLSR